VLLAIANAAGGQWPERARKAACLLLGKEVDSESPRILLLRDLKSVFDELGEALTSEQIVKALVAIEGHPWSEWKGNKPLTKTGLRVCFVHLGFDRQYGVKTMRQCADTNAMTLRIRSPDTWKTKRHKRHKLLCLWRFQLKINPVKSRIKKSLIGKWSAERWSVLRELWRSQVSKVNFYMSPEGGSLSMEDAQRLTSGEYVFSSAGGELKLVPRSGTQEEKVDRELSHSLSWDVDHLTWYGLNRLFKANPELAEQVWDEVKEQAARDFKSGHFAAELFERTDWQKNVWKRAHFVAVFQMMIESYKPRDAIEHQMVEMAAVEYFLWRHWTAEHMQRATTEPQRENQDYKEWREREKEIRCKYGREPRPIQGQWIAGAWELPYQDQADAIEQAAELADRFRRAYHAAIGALRDWRRYPVIVQNAEQVNIAADGGQQVNIQRQKPSTQQRSPSKGKRGKPKQLGAKKGSIRMKPALKSVLVE
jgi:Protein of unknown function (DUF3631)